MKNLDNISNIFADVTELYFINAVNVKFLKNSASIDTLSLIDIEKPIQQLWVNGHSVQLQLKTFTTQFAYTALWNKSRSHKVTVFVNDDSRKEKNFWKYNVASTYHKVNGLLVAGSIIVAEANPEVPVFVLVRVALVYGECKDIDGVLWDIEAKELRIICNSGDRKIYQSLQKGKYKPNLTLEGQEIDALLKEANEAYMTFMDEKGL